MPFSSFLKLFPPPKYLAMPYSGLDISDDSVTCLEYADSIRGRRISKYARTNFPPGVMIGGDIKEEKSFMEILTAFAKEHKISRAKVSLPEEKVYLFQTGVPESDARSMAFNIESKLEENVPVSAPDAIFHFDLLPDSVTGGNARASVSVAPRAYIEKYVELLKQASITPVAFEVVPKAIARAVVSKRSKDTQMIIHAMNKKTGIDIVSDGVVCFSSTIAWGSRAGDATKSPAALDVEPLVKEINRAHSYWVGRKDVHSEVSHAMIVGVDALLLEETLRSGIIPVAVQAVAANIWRNAFDLNEYLPPISKEESFGYAAAAGLALLCDN